MPHDRREFLKRAAALAAATAWTPVSAQPARRTRLILLGTKGGPRVGPDRANSSTLLLVDGTPLVVDCGYGATRQLLLAGVQPGSVRRIFITHHHSDHNLEYGPLFYNGWVSGQPVRMDAYGPPGLTRMTQAFFEYMKIDIDTRIADEGRPDPRPLLVPHEIDRPGLVLEEAGVRVTAALVRHPPFDRAYAFRFDTPDRSLVISGDTAAAPALVALAKGADVLVHEVMHPSAIDTLAARVPNAARLREHLAATHTLPADVGRAASEAGVKLVVLTHFVPGDDPSLTDDRWAEGVRQHFDGRVVVGKDLMEV